MARAKTIIGESISQADFVPRRQTRAFAASLQAFTYNDNAIVGRRVKHEDPSDDDSSLSSAASNGSIFDIEDIPFSSSASKKRKRGFDSPSTAVTSVSTVTSTRTSPRKAGLNNEDGVVGKVRKGKRQPAKRIVNGAGEEEVQPPASWEEIYSVVQDMRKEKLAPVDTMGCETLAEEHLTAKVYPQIHWPSDWIL